MSKRFVTLSGNGSGRFANLRERLEAPLPGEANLVPSTDPKFAQRDPAFRPLVSASTTPAPVAKAKPKAKSASEIAAEEFANRAARVMASPAAMGKKKAAAKLLATGASAGSIIEKLLAMQADDVRERNAIDAIWSRAIAAVNGERVGLGANATKQDREIDALWTRAVNAVNAEGVNA